MDTTSLLIKLNELAPEFRWSHEDEDGYLTYYITGRVHGVKDLRVMVEFGRKDYYEVCVFTNKQGNNSRDPVLEIALNRGLKMAFNAVMAGIIYDSKESYARWVKSVNQVVNENRV